MRKAMLYNFLLEATIIASIAIVLMLLVRKFFRKWLGSRAIAFAWLLVAIRLLCPLSLPNPAINEIRSPYAPDQAIRPIAGQVQVRMKDLAGDLARMQYRLDLDRDNAMVKTFRSIEGAIYNGRFAEGAFWVYIAGAACVTVWFVFRNIRFRHMLRTGRVEALSGKVETEYHQLCVRRRAKPLPVYYTDPLPSACLVGVFQPYIALPLTSRPVETVRVLEHEICHYKGRDHLWGVVRLLCCIVHWFNPLVWLAASVSMNDCELACDERVVQALSEEERRAYAEILVLAAARKNAPGLPVLATGMTMTGKKLKERVRSIVHNSKTVRWLAIVFSTVACAALVCAFATSEFVPSVRFSLGSAGPTAVYAKTAIEDSNAAEKRAKELWQSTYLAYRAERCEWSTEKRLGGYVVNTRSAGGEQTAVMTLLPDGTVVHFDNASESPWYESTPVEGKVTDESWDELGAYLLDFMDSVLPGHSNTVEAFSQGEVIENGGSRYATMTGITLTPLGLEPGYSFLVKLTGDTPQIIYFCMEQPVLNRLWKEGMTDLSAPEAHRINGLLARAYTEADGMGQICKPDADDLSAEEALQIAMDAICDTYGETPETLRRFEVRYKYNNEGTPHQWRFDFEYVTPRDMYFVYLDANTGEILQTVGRDEGNG